jgi:hypothetical protein
MSVPGIGAKGADKILELREAKGDLLFILWCMRVCTIFNGPDFYTGPLLSTFV